MEQEQPSSVPPDEAILRPAGELTIFEAAQYHADLLALHQQEGPLFLDLTDVTCMDSSCVQLTVAATRPGRLNLRGHSHVIRDKFEQIGFGQFLPAPESIEQVQ